jgi:transketolase
MRIAFVKALIEGAKRYPDLHLLTADLGFEVFEDFMQKFPDKFTNVGVAENNMVGVASGLSQLGQTVICYSISPFLTHRAFEFIRNDVCYPNLNVKFVGVGAGLAYALNGPSHHANEDIAVMRTLPNMTIICPSDPIETYLATLEMIKTPGPFYLRLGKRGEPNLSYEFIKYFTIGKIIKVRSGKNLALFSTGTMLETSLEVAEILGKKGINPTIIHVHTIKPLDIVGIKQEVFKHQKIITIEEHSKIGGLGSAIAEVNVSCNNAPKPQLIFGVEDKFFNTGGTQLFIRKSIGLDAESISKRIIKWL